MHEILPRGQVSCPFVDDCSSSVFIQHSIIMMEQHVVNCERSQTRRNNINQGISCLFRCQCKISYGCLWQLGIHIILFQRYLVYYTCSNANEQNACCRSPIKQRVPRTPCDVEDKTDKQTVDQSNGRLADGDIARKRTVKHNQGRERNKRE